MYRVYKVYAIHVQINSSFCFFFVPMITKEMCNFIHVLAFRPYDKSFESFCVWYYKERVFFFFFFFFYLGIDP